MVVMIPTVMAIVFLAVAPVPQAPAPQAPVTVASGSSEGNAAATPPDAVVETQPVAQRPAPPAQRADRRRRGSMVGYVEDSTVKSQFRLRFDSGWSMDTPDRAEFFYAKCGCYQADPPPFFDPDAPGPGLGVPTELNFQQLYLQGEYAVNPRFSFFGELPFRFIQPQGFIDFGPSYPPFPDQSGLGDIRVGAKAGLIDEADRALTAQVRMSFPTGDSSKGLSTDNPSLEPALLYHQTLTDRLGLEAQIGMWFPLGGSAGVPTDSPDDFSGKVLFYGIGPSFDLVTTDRVRFAPVVELVGWRVFGGFQTRCELDASACTYDTDSNIVNLKIGARTTVDEKHSLYAGFGWALTSASWYEQVLRFEYRFGF